MIRPSRKAVMYAVAVVMAGTVASNAAPHIQEKTTSCRHVVEDFMKREVGHLVPSEKSMGRSWQEDEALQRAVEGGK